MSTPCVIIGSGNIGTDLMHKMLRSEVLDLRAVVGIDPDSEGLRLAAARGIDTSHHGADWVIDHADEFELVFEATSAYVHRDNAPRYAAAGLTAIDLTPAAVGPLVVPSVNSDAVAHADNVNLITCGGQATTPIVAAVANVCRVPYAEIVSTVASLSAGPGTRRNIDEFTKTTARALREVGGAEQSKAIMVLNPADPPILMRNTVYCGLPEDADHHEVARAITDMVQQVQQHVPGYRLKAEPVFDVGPFATPGGPAACRVAVLLEVEGAGDFFPPYAGNLDIMTAAAVAVGESLATRRLEVGA